MDRPAWAIGRKAQVVYAAPAPAAAPSYYAAAPAQYYAPAPAPAYYAPAPAYYPAAPAYYPQQPAYYVQGKHHKQYLLSPPPYASYPYYGSTSTSSTSAAPAATSAAPATTAASAPGDTGTTSGDASQFELSGAVLDTLLDDLRRYYAANPNNQSGMERVGALRDEARRLYTTYTGKSQVVDNSEADLRLRQIVDQVVKEERDRTFKLSRRMRSGYDQDEDLWGQRPYYYPPPGYYPAAPPLYYVPASHPGLLGH
jgi:hypothetical protein